MPTLTATQFTGQSFIDVTLPEHLEDAVYVSNSSTQILLANSVNPDLATLITGTGFMFIGDTPIAGTITGMEFYDSSASVTNNLIAELSGLSVGLVDFFFAVDEALNDDDTLLVALFSTYDVVYDATAVTSEETRFEDSGFPLGDTAIAGAGGSFMALDLFADTYVAGTGFDQISFATEEGGFGAVVDLGAGTISDTYGNVETLVQTTTAYFESLVGSQNADSLTGNEFDNTLRGFAGNDLLDGAGGIDTVRYDNDISFGGGGNIFVDLSANTATDGFGTTDTLFNIENVIGSQGDDFIDGDAEDNVILGLGGNDRISGGGGNDTIDPGDNSGGDLLELSEGNDTYIFSDANPNDSFYTISAEDAPVSIAFTIDGVANTGSIDKDIFGTDTLVDIQRPLDAGAIAGGLELIGGDAADMYTLTLGAGQWMRIQSSAGDDTLIISGAGTVRASYAAGLGPINADLVAGTITGGADIGTDTVVGVLGQIEGTNFDDIFTGTTADETFFGKAGDDLIDGGGGEDTVRYDRDASAGGALGVIVNLGAGIATDGFGDTDTLIGITNVRGTNNNDVIEGDAGDNVIRGLGGNDRINGGSGNDTINPGDNNGFDQLELSEGNDTYIFSGANLNNSFYEISVEGAPVTITFNIDGVNNTGSIDKGPFGFDTLIDIERPLMAGDNFGGLDLGGGDAGDVYNLTVDAGQWMQVTSSAGDDTLNISGDGLVRLDYSDALGPISANLDTGIITGGADVGTDTVNGALAQIFGTRFADTMIGSANNETFFTNGGGDFVDGAGGTGDRLRYDRVEFGPMRIDVLLGTAIGTWNGFDFTDTFQGIERFRGSFDDDIIQGSFVNEVLQGRGGDDWLDGRAGDDQIAGEAGNDVVRGGLGNDMLSGGDGNDILIGNGGNDILDGGEGVDTVTYREATGGVTVDLTLVQDVGSGEGTDQFISIENVDGGFFDDQITGDEFQNVLRGQAGNDTLDGAGGDDFLYGGVGDDTIFGGDGADFILAGNGDDTVNGGAGGDYIEGGNGQDTIFGDDGDDNLQGERGNDTIFGGTGNDTIFAGAGFDLVRGGANDDTIDGGNGNDRLFGDAGNDTIFGDIGSDTIFGGAGNDVIRGGGWKDTLYGGAGNDRLFGDWGEDVLFGGTGDNLLVGGNGNPDGDNLTDVFVFKSTANGGTPGTDRIRDFENGIDLLDLSESGYTAFSDVADDATDVGSDLQIVFDFGGVLIIENFSKAEFDASDVIGL